MLVLSRKKKQALKRYVTKKCSACAMNKKAK